MGLNQVGAVTSVGSRTGAVVIEEPDVRVAVEHSSAPSSPVVGELWYDSVNNLWNRWDGSAWVGEGSAAYQAAFMIPEATGVAATDTANWTAAINDAKAAGRGLVVPLGGTYAINASLPQIDKPGISIHGPGSRACILQPTAALGAAHVLRWLTNPFTTEQGGKIAGLTIDGTNAAAGAIGLHMGDIIGAELDDVTIENFTGVGSEGLRIDNADSWTERLQVNRLWLNNNTTNLRYVVTGTGQNSFGYHRYGDLRLNLNAGQVGFSVEDGGQLYGLDLVGLANLSGAAPTIIKVTAAGSPSISGRIFLPWETTGASVTRFDLADDAQVYATGSFPMGIATDTIGVNAHASVGIAQDFENHNAGLTCTTATWAFPGALNKNIVADVGDQILCSVSFIANNDAAGMVCDFGTLSQADNSVISQFSTRAAVDDANNGLIGGTCDASTFPKVCLTASYIVTAADLLNGVVRVAPIFRLTSGAGRNLIAPIRFEATNLTAH